MRNIEERGITFTVYAGLSRVRRCLREFVSDFGAYMDWMDVSEVITDRSERDSSEGYILSGQAGVLEGMKYPMHGRYTSWNVQVIVTENCDSCEVILDAIGDKRIGNNLSIRCSESHRDKLESYIRDSFSCSRSTRIF